MIPESLIRRYCQLLLQLPDVDTFRGRTSIFDGLVPSALLRAVHRDETNAKVDIWSIVNALSKVGKAYGVYPLESVAEGFATMPFVRGGARNAQMSEWRDVLCELRRHYGSIECPIAEKNTRRLAFYRYRHIFSSGPGDWQYAVFGVVDHQRDLSEDLSETARELRNLFDDDCHYRGVDIEEIAHPPADWICAQIAKTERALRGHSEILKLLRKHTQTSGGR